MSTEITAGNESVVRAREVLLADLKRVVSDADQLFGELSTSTVDEFTSVRHRFENKLGEARSKIDAARTLATRKACAAADATNVYISENPAKVIGLASLVGLLAAFLLFRRSTR